MHIVDTNVFQNTHTVSGFSSGVGITHSRMYTFPRAMRQTMRSKAGTFLRWMTPVMNLIE